MAESFEEAKKARSSETRLLTRRIGELRATYSRGGSSEEVMEKIFNVKSVFDELGYLHDHVLSYLGDDDTSNAQVQSQEEWYSRYDINVTDVIVTARKYLDELGHTQAERSAVVTSVVKFQKLQIPVFDSQPRKYLKWKATFERYTDNVRAEVKYDY